MCSSSRNIRRNLCRECKLEGKKSVRNAREALRDPVNPCQNEIHVIGVLFPKKREFLSKSRHLGIRLAIDRCIFSSHWPLAFEYLKNVQLLFRLSTLKSETLRTTTTTTTSRNGGSRSASSGLNYYSAILKASTVLNDIKVGEVWKEADDRQTLAKYGPQENDNWGVKELMDEQEVSLTRKEKRAHKRKNHTRTQEGLSAEKLSAEKLKKKHCIDLAPPNRFEVRTCKNGRNLDSD